MAPAFCYRLRVYPKNILKKFDVTIDITTKKRYTLDVIKKITTNYLGGIHHEDGSGMREW